MNFMILLLITVVSVDIKVGCGETPPLTLEDKRQMDMGFFECPQVDEDE